MIQLNGASLHLFFAVNRSWFSGHWMWLLGKSGWRTSEAFFEATNSIRTPWTVLVNGSLGMEDGKLLSDNWQARKPPTVMKA